MKRNSTFPAFCKSILLVASIAAFTFKTKAQTYPSLSFTNGVLSSGTAKQVGATYKFSNVTTGVDAMVKIDSLVGGATLSTIDSVGTGYNEAFQPIIMSQPGKASYAVITISFVGQQKVPLTYMFPSLSVAAIDIDGDNAGAKEYAGIDMGGGKAANLTSTSKVALTVSGTNFRGTNTDGLTLAGIDTSNYDGMYKVQSTSVSSVAVRFGVTLPSTAAAQARYYSVYFKDFAIRSAGATATTSNTSSSNSRVITTLPLKLVSFTATTGNNHQSVLNWTTAWEKETAYFSVEKSNDNKSFQPVTKVIAATQSNTAHTYTYTDASEMNKVTYYRLKCIDQDGKFTYSETRIIRTANDGTQTLSLFPNPATQQVNITIPSNWQGKKVKYEVYTNYGQLIKQYETSAASQNQTIGLENMAKGLYIVKATAEQISIQQQLVKL